LFARCQCRQPHRRCRRGCDGWRGAYSATSLTRAVSRPQRGLPFGTAPGDFPSRCEPPPRTMVSWSDPGHRRRHEPPDRTPSLALAKGRRSEPPGSRATPPSRTPAVCTWTSDGAIHVPSQQTAAHCRHRARRPGISRVRPRAVVSAASL